MASAMRYFLPLLIAIIPYAYASDCPQSDSRCKKASQLVAILGYDEAIRAFQDSCIEQSKAFSPDVMAKSDKTLFYGVTPESPKWPKVLRAYEDYRAEYCGDAIRPVLLDAYRDAWAKNLDDQELSSAITYMRSPEGGSFARALPNIYKSVTHRALPAFNEMGRQAYLRLAKRLRAIADE